MAHFRRISRRAVPLVWLPIALGAVAVLLLPGSGPYAPPPGADVPEPPAASDRTPDTVTCHDGRVLRGEVVRTGTDARGLGYIVLRGVDGKERIIASSAIRALERGPVRRGAPVTIRMRSGRSVRAELLTEHPRWIEVRLASGSLVKLRRTDVAAIESRTN